MLGFGKKNKSSKRLACFLSTVGYSLVSLSDSNNVNFYENHYFTESYDKNISKSLALTVEKHDLYGNDCHIILAPNLYQLHLMDMPDVPEVEVAKALRWQLKGLIDYPLNDIVVDAFAVPPHGPGARRKKVFAAITLQSALQNKIDLLKNCYLNVASASIAELALGQLITSIPTLIEAPCLVVSYDDDICQVHMFYADNLYLFRTLSIDKSIISDTNTSYGDLILEIQRSIDYCIMELKLPEPKQIFFTPSFYQAIDLFTILSDELDKKVQLMPINDIFPSLKIDKKELVQAFYALGGALLGDRRGDYAPVR